MYREEREGAEVYRKKEMRLQRGDDMYREEGEGEEVYREDWGREEV